MKSGVKPPHSKTWPQFPGLQSALALWSAPVLRRFGCFGLTAGFAADYVNKSAQAAGLCSSTNHD
jgi:hypothetical protein